MPPIDMLFEFLIIRKLPATIYITPFLLLIGHVNESSGRLFNIRLINLLDSCRLVLPSLTAGCWLSRSHCPPNFCSDSSISFSICPSIFSVPPYTTAPRHLSAMVTKSKSSWLHSLIISNTAHTISSLYLALNSRSTRRLMRTPKE